MVGEGKKLTPEVNKAAMMRFATVPLTPEELDEMEEEYREKTIEDRVTEPEVEVEKVGAVMNGVAPLSTEAEEAQVDDGLASTGLESNTAPIAV